MLKKRYKSPVTIITAIKCEGGIVVASDSRTTEFNGHIRDDVQKVYIVQSQSGHKAVIAGAGNAIFGGRAMEMIAERASETEFDKARTLADCAEAVAKDLKAHIREQAGHQATSVDIQRQYMDYGFQILMAHYWNDQPYVFILDLLHGLAKREDNLAVAIGCGRSLADFLIARLDFSGAKVGHGLWASVHIIAEVKKADAACGGTTQVAVCEGARAFFAARDQMDILEQDALEFSRETKSNWSKNATDRIRKIAPKLKISAPSKAAEPPTFSSTPTQTSSHEDSATDPVS